MTGQEIRRTTTTYQATSQSSMGYVTIITARISIAVCQHSIITIVAARIAATEVESLLHNDSACHSQYGVPTSQNLLEVRR